MSVVFPLAHLKNDPVLARWVPYVATVDEVLDAAECAALIARAEAAGLEPASIHGPTGEVMNTRVRNNERAMFDDEALAARLWSRIAPALPGPTLGLNPRFRCYRYRPGQQFAPHTDGRVQVGDAVSTITVLFYLDEGCAGGETRFVDWDLAVRPRRGMALLFAHEILHEGAEVRRGEKHVLRSDVLQASR